MIETHKLTADEEARVEEFMSYKLVWIANANGGYYDSRLTYVVERESARAWKLSKVNALYERDVIGTYSTLRMAKLQAEDRAFRAHLAALAK